MILKKNLSDEPGSGSSAAILGLKVIGGRITEAGTVGAIIEKVKKGSIADTVGRLRAGDEVLEWNGRSLRHKTYEEVYDIIAESKQEPQVELIVSRPIRRPAGLPATVYQSEPSRSTFEPRSRISRRFTDVDLPIDPHYDKQQLMLRQTSLGAEIIQPRTRISRSSTISGRLQVKLWYDIQSLQLMITIISAVELPPRSNGSPRTAFCKIALLPERRERSKRRTRAIPGTNEPRWDKSFVYSPLRRSDLKTKALEIMIWDHDRYAGNEFLGEVIIELATAPLDDEPEWYLLETHEETIAQLRIQQKLYLLPSDQFSPPSPSSRLSDSDTSELDLYDYDSEIDINASRESWHGLLAETSQSSFGSTASPPLVLDETGGVASGAEAGNASSQLRRSANKSIGYQGQAYRRAFQTKALGDFNRGPLLSAAHPFQASTSLPSSSIHLLDRMKPKFRKSSSQPSRSLSPPSLRFASPSIDEGYYRGSKPIPTTPTGSPFQIKKRRLPAVPFLRRASRDRDIVAQEAQGYDSAIGSSGYPLQPEISLAGRSKQYKTSLHQRRSTEALTSGGMYSDSEIVNRPQYDRLFYAHPHRSSTSSRGRNRRGSEINQSSDAYAGEKAPVERRDSRQKHTSGRTELDAPGNDNLAGTGVRHRKERGSIKVKPGNVASEDESESSSKASENSAFSNISSRPRMSRTQGEYREHREHREHRESREYREYRDHRDHRDRDHREGREHRTHRESISGKSEAMGHGLTLRISMDEEEDSQDNKIDASLSDSAILRDGASSEPASSSKIRSETSDKQGNTSQGASGATTKTGKYQSGMNALSKAKSSSTSQLSVTGTKKRLGFRRKQATSFSVHRSEEVAPDDIRHLVKQGSSISSDGEGSLSGESSATWVPQMRFVAEGEVSNFVEGLGPGQLVGRQALASPNLGDIQLSICDSRGNLEVEVIRARGLQTKPGSKMSPATYVKVYMVKGRKCIAKAKTSIARRTLDPLYQQKLIFHEDYRGCVLQVTVWGDYGRIEKKAFMGVVQIVLDDLDLSNIVIGWYKLFHPSSLISLPIEASARQGMMASDSFG
uniref:Regulating synaptic membrane exocytosis protein 2 n=3 Tax=Tetranychus urticae TaxID=32264 RepID=T1L2L6_TETUR